MKHLEIRRGEEFGGARGDKEVTGSAARAPHSAITKRIGVALAVIATLACFAAAATLSSGPAEVAGSSEEMTPIQ